jgi:hypothetical protein
VANQALVDFRDPERPRSLSVQFGSEAFSRPAVHGGLAYLPGGYDGGLQVVDLRDPESVTALATIDGLGAIGTLDQQDGPLVAEALSDRLVELDVSRPFEPTASDTVRDSRRRLLGSARLVTPQHAVTADEMTLVIAPRTSDGVTQTLEIASAPADMAYEDGHLYIADSGWDYDIIRPGPKWLEVVQLDDGTPASVGKLAFPNPLSAVAVHEGTAWVLVSNGDTFLIDDDSGSRLVALDVREPSSPTVIAEQSRSIRPRTSSSMAARCT